MTLKVLLVSYKLKMKHIALIILVISPLALAQSDGNPHVSIKVKLTNIDDDTHGRRNRGCWGCYGTPNIS